MLVVTLLTAAACGPRAVQVLPPPPVAQSPADQLYDLSSVRLQMRRLGPQAVRLLAPHWTRIRESDRRMLQATLAEVFAEERLEPLVRARLRTAAEARPDLAAETLEWLRGPIGYEVKFADATARGGGKSTDAMFYATVAAVREGRAPAIRLDPIRRLADATEALEHAVDTTTAVGTVVARLVNVARPGVRPLALATLRETIERERQRPEVAETYRPVVTASLLVRCRDLDLRELDEYIAFASTEAGRWYHDTVAGALAGAVEQSSTDVEDVFEANAHSQAPAPDLAGIDLDSLLVSLPSGREVRLLAFAQGGADSEPAIMLRYETSLPLGDSAAVGKEAAEVWEKVRDEIDSEGVRAAMLQATGSVQGWVFPFASSRKYAWQRDEGGPWTTMRADGAGALQREMLWSSPP